MQFINNREQMGLIREKINNNFDALNNNLYVLANKEHIHSIKEIEGLSDILESVFLQINEIASGFTIRITFDLKLVGETFTVSSKDFDFSGTVPAELKKDIVVPYEDASYFVECGLSHNHVNVKHFFGIYPVHLDSVSLNDFTWEEISSISQAGNASDYLNIGDEKDIQLTDGQVITLQIYGFDHDDLSSGGTAGITFGMKDTMTSSDLNENGARRMEATDTNANSFAGSEMFNWLNGGLFDSLPSDLQSVMQEVNKKTSVGSTSTTIRTDPMKMFLFSMSECIEDGVLNGVPFLDEGELYPIFSDNTSRTKRSNNGAGGATFWWSRSPYIPGVAQYFTGFGPWGGASYSSATNNTTNKVCFGFCV